MFKRIIYLITLVIVLLPMVSFAAGAGFAPSGVWFGRTSLAEGELARVYTVIVNNDYFAIDAEVGFYDNNNLIDTAKVKRLPRESAQDLRIFWQPTMGEHKLFARFISATAIDEKGGRANLDVGDMGGTAGAPLLVVDKTTGAVVQSDALTGADPHGISHTLVVEVQKQGNQVAVTEASPAGAAEGVILGVKQIVAATQKLFGQASGTIHSSSLRDAFNKNREVLAGVSGAVDQATSTAAAASAVYVKANQLAVQGQNVYGQARCYWAVAQPYAEAARPWWQKISDNNSPTRVLEIFIIIIIAWFILKRLRRLFFVMFVLRHSKQRRR